MHELAGRTKSVSYFFVGHAQSVLFFVEHLLSKWAFLQVFDNDSYLL